jgi:hypothetical protein
MSGICKSPILNNFFMNTTPVFIIHKCQKTKMGILANQVKYGYDT